MQQKKRNNGMVTTFTLCTRLPQCSYVVGYYDDGTSAGVFAFSTLTGGAAGNVSFRVVLVP